MCPLRVQDLLRAFLLLLRGPSPPWAPDRLLRRLSIFFWAPIRSRVLRRRLVQVARPFRGTLWPLLEAGMGGREPIARFCPCDPEFGGPCHLLPPRRATQWSFASPGGGLPPRSRCASSLLRLRLSALLHPPQPRSLPPLRSSPPYPPFGLCSHRARGGSDPGRRTEGARGARSPNKTPP